MSSRYSTPVLPEVRVDVWDDARRLPEGSRVAVVVSYGEASPGIYGSLGQPYAPRITVHGDGGERASHIVLPFTEGSAGGTVKTLTSSTDRHGGGVTSGPDEDLRLRIRTAPRFAHTRDGEGVRDSGPRQLEMVKVN